MSAADPLGYDVLVDEHDLDPSGRSASGVELVLAAAAHRMTCAQLAMVDAPDGQIDFGIDVRRWVGEATTADAITAKLPLLDEALHRDPRIAATRLQLDAITSGADASISLRLQLSLVTGETLSRIVSISAVSVAFLAGS
jgi:hypothetical protein